jgi:glucose-6-phosphate 1-epimerase
MHLHQNNLGALVTSIKSGFGDDILYFAKKISETESNRGGCPVIFPQFGEGPLKKHGFARDLPWRLIEEKISDLEQSSTFELVIAEIDIAEWPYSCCLTLHSIVKDNSFEQKLIIENNGNVAFDFTCGLHPYFLVDELEMVSILGLEGYEYFDRVKHQFFKNDSIFLFDGDVCEKLFNVSPRITLSTGSKSLSLSCSGFNQWMIWNPGRIEAKKIFDLPDADWNRFVCVEPVIAGKSKRLSPGDSFAGSLIVELLENMPLKVDDKN